MYIGRSQPEARINTQVDHQSRSVDDDRRQLTHEHQDGKPQILLLGKISVSN